MSVTSATNATKSGEEKERVVGMEVSTPSMLRVTANYVESVEIWVLSQF